MNTRGPVIVMELPQKMDSVGKKKFLSELRPLLETHRPRVVLDCSQIQQMDSAAIELLLHCMEEAMKRDGDLKLAAVSPASAAIMELLRVDRLFEVFATAEEATRSYQAVTAPAAPQTLPWYSSASGLADLNSI
jgi:anti-sigma B factor antagonist